MATGLAITTIMAGTANASELCGDNDYVMYLYEACPHDRAEIIAISKFSHVELCYDCLDYISAFDSHQYAGGVCAICGYECMHSDGFADLPGGAESKSHMCMICQLELPHDLVAPASSKFMVCLGCDHKEQIVWHLEGKCGDAVNYIYDNGVLTITGTGEMYENIQDIFAPWYELEVKRINVDDTITYIGSGAFEGIDRGVGFYCTSGSYASGYATENGFECHYTDKLNGVFLDKATGEWKCYSDGIFLDKKYGIFKGQDDNRWYVIEGVLQTDFTGLIRIDGIFYGVVNGKLVNDSGVIRHGNDFWYIKNGIYDATYEGIVENAGEKWLYKHGKLQSGFTGITSVNDEYYYVINGKVASNFTGMYENAGIWWYIKEGRVATEIKGLVENAGARWYVTGGRILTDVTGIVIDDADRYMAIMGGKLIESTFLMNYVDAYWYIVDGYLASDYTGEFEYGGIVYNIFRGKVTGHK